MEIRKYLLHVLLLLKLPDTDVRYSIFEECDKIEFCIYIILLMAQVSRYPQTYFLYVLIAIQKGEGDFSAFYKLRVVSCAVCVGILLYHFY